MGVIIKRYPNRKLYDTVKKEYITLDSIAHLIRQGQDVHVVDNATGEDLTAVTLSQIVFELEKRKAGSYSKSLLAGLVQSGGETLEAVRRTLTTPLDLSRHLEDEIERRIDLLIAENEITYEDGHSLLEKLQAVGRRKLDEGSLLDKTIHKVIGESGFPSREDITRLRSRVDTLSQLIDELESQKPKA